jgi:plasmid stabilization system protein ParE
MASELIFAPEAEQDLAEAYAWYEAQRAGLGEEFMRCIDARIQAICRMPEICAVVHENHRRALVRRFPYAIFYEHVNDVVTVYCVFQTSQDPQKWRLRLP